MPALQVKDFPSDLYEDLRACASRQDRSLSQQMTRHSGVRSGFHVPIAFPLA